MSIFLIDENDENFKIEDGGCVDECVSTLLTSDIKLHYHNGMIDFSDPKHRKLVIRFDYDSALFEYATCVMTGTIINLKIAKNKKSGKLQVSFGGLIGEFILKENQLQSMGLSEDNINMPNKVYLYIS